jgi:putative redox protein
MSISLSIRWTVLHNARGGLDRAGWPTQQDLWASVGDQLWCRNSIPSQFLVHKNLHKPPAVPFGPFAAGRPPAVFQPEISHAQPVPHLTVAHVGDHRFQVNVEGGRLSIEGGMAIGRRDSRPTPTELLAASLASCAAAYAESYLSSHSYATDGLSVGCDYRLSADQPASVGSLEVTVIAPRELPVDRRRALLQAVENCMVGNTLGMPPFIRIVIADGEDPTRGAESP